MAFTYSPFGVAGEPSADVLEHQGDFDEPVTCYHGAIEVAPANGRPAFALATEVLKQGNVGAALPLLKRAAELERGSADIHLAYARALYEARELPAALSAFETAIRLDPGNARAQFERARVLLAMGDLARGWAAYEWRLALMQRDQGRSGRPPRFSWPGRSGPPLAPWQGEDVAGRTILIQGEQGHGDILQFIRYVPMVVARNAKVFVKVWSGLRPLLAEHPEFGTVVDSHDGLPPIERFSLLMSLPAVLGQPAVVPAAVPYIRANAVSIARWAVRLADAGPGRRVGLVWSGDPTLVDGSGEAIDHRRSLHLADLNALLGMPGVTMVSLQVGARAVEAEGQPILDLSTGLTDFAETAAVIANLDLVIAVDTAVAHLAGAMGKPIWLLSRFDACWRWLQDRDDNPWYPTLRLYRQARPGDWGTVISRIAADLERYAQTS